MAINFPSSPLAGQIFNACPGLSFVYRNGAWRRAPLTTALPKNLLVNPSMQVSQELGLGNYGASTLNATYYAGDQWVLEQAHNAIWKGGTTTNGGVSPNGSLYSLEMNCATPDPTAIAAGWYNVLDQRVEANRVTELRWGQGGAFPVVLRFWLKAVVTTGNVGGTSVFVRNSANDYSFVSPVNTNISWTKYEIAIPAPPAVTFGSGNAQCFNLGICGACGTTFTTPTPGAWVSGNYLGSGNAQWGRTGVLVGNLYLADVGLYADPYATGVAPPYVVPPIAQETARCKRYWYKAFGMQAGVGNGTQANRGGMRHPVPMRANPAAAIVGTPRLFDGTVTPAITSLPNNYSNTYAAELDIVTAGTFATVGKAAAQYYVDDNTYIAMNARI